MEISTTQPPVTPPSASDGETVTSFLKLEEYQSTMFAVSEHYFSDVSSLAVLSSTGSDGRGAALVVNPMYFLIR